MILYNLKTDPRDGYNFSITKFDDDLNIESSYSVNTEGCTCPQGHKPTCRHRKMLGAMLGIVDTEVFYCYDDHSYRKANGLIMTNLGEIAKAPVSEARPGSILIETPIRRRV